MYRKVFTVLTTYIFLVTEVDIGPRNLERVSLEDFVGKWRSKDDETQIECSSAGRTRIECDEKYFTGELKEKAKLTVSGNTIRPSIGSHRYYGNYSGDGVIFWSTGGNPWIKQGIQIDIFQNNCEFLSLYKLLL